MKIVISQPMLFPWVGMLEQVRAADVFVHYPDVQFSKGSFVNRVQVKTAAGPRWLTVPLDDLHLGQLINEVRVNNRKDWRSAHLSLLADAFAGCPFADDALSVARSAYEGDHVDIASLSEDSLMAVCGYYGLDKGRSFLRSSDLGISGSGSQRVLDIVRSLGGDTYITGHGARHYLDHEAFERAGIAVRYMDYRANRYPQRHGDFTPYVTSLDLIANTGGAGLARIEPVTIDWKEFTRNG